MKKGTIYAVVFALFLTGCSQPKEIESTSVEAPVESEAQVAKSEPVQGVEHTGLYAFDQYEINLPAAWLELETQVNEAEGVWKLESETGITLNLSIVKDEIREINETSIRDEVSLASQMHLESETVVTLENGTTFYGAYIEDEGTKRQFLYYLTRHNEKIVSVLFSTSKGYSEEEIKWIHDILNTFKINE